MDDERTRLIAHADQALARVTDPAISERMDELFEIARDCYRLLRDRGSIPAEATGCLTGAIAAHLHMHSLNERF